MIQQCVLLLEKWLDFEQKKGDAANLTDVKKRLPKKVIKKRKVIGPGGIDLGLEEYIDYIFPGDEEAKKLKILEKARLWKRAKLQLQQEQQQDNN